MIRWSPLTQGTPQSQSSLPHWGKACQQASGPHDITPGCSEFNSALLCQSWQLLSARQDWNLLCISPSSAGPTCSLSLGSSSRSTESGNWWLVRARPGLTRGKDLNAAVPGCCWQLSALSSYERLDGSRGWLGAGRLVHRWCKVFRV